LFFVRRRCVSALQADSAILARLQRISAAPGIK
jgi:hypothetical protein